MASSNAKSVAESYIGSFISLISKYEIRYEGVLYLLNVHDSTIGLKNVRSYGTEGRKKDGPQVPGSEKVYEYILFRGSDIKDLEVKSSPPPQREEQIYEDPAIIQTQYAGVPTNSPPSTSVGGKTLTETSPWQDTPALTSRTNPGALPSYQPVTQVCLLNHTQATPSTGSPGFSTPVYQQGYDGALHNISHSPQIPISFQSPSMVSPPLTVENGVQTYNFDASPISGLTNVSGSVTNLPSLIGPNSLFPNILSSLTPAQSSSTLDMSFSSPFKPIPPSTAAYMTDNNLTMSLGLNPSACQNTRSIEAQFPGKAVSDPVPVHPTQSMPFTGSPLMGSASGPLLTPHLPLLTPNQLAPAIPPGLPSMQKMYPDKKDMGVTPSTSYNPPSAVSTQVTQAPLLPLPIPALQSQYSTAPFTEEFDFEAMNEKFKKDEVWGYLGKEKQKDKTEDVEDNATDQSIRDEEAHGLVNNVDPKSAYKKDDFFDTISCNSLTRGARDGQNRFSERMKQDTETFGNFRQRHHLGYGGYGTGRGQNYRGSYSGGRGYGYDGRRRGGNMNI